jgi:transposase, IS6 family
VAVLIEGKGFKGRQFTSEIILWAVRWYLMFPVSYRDLELMLQDWVLLQSPIYSAFPNKNAS